MKRSLESAAAAFDCGHGSHLGDFLQLSTKIRHTAIGGAIFGAVVGLDNPNAISHFFADITTDVKACARAALIIVITGIVFGSYPARRTAMMNPVEALCHE